MTFRPLPEQQRSPRRVGESLDGVTRSLGGPSAAALASVFGRWPAIVGPQLAARSRPLSLSRKVLTVAVDQPAWATQFKFFEADIRRRLDESLGPGVVERLAVRVRPR